MKFQESSPASYKEKPSKDEQANLLIPNGDAPTIEEHGFFTKR